MFYREIGCRALDFKQLWVGFIRPNRYGFALEVFAQSIEQRCAPGI